MLTKLDPKTGVPHIREIRPDLKELKDVEKEIEVKLLNGVLFASDAVIKSMAEFVRNPAYSSYIKTAVATRTPTTPRTRLSGIVGWGSYKASFRARLRAWSAG